MVSTYTPNLRITRQGDNDNPNTWGQIVNNQVITLLEEAISGVVNIDCTGSADIDLSATTANGSTDDARHAVLELTGVLGGNIQLILPAVDKIYYIRAAQTGGFTISVKPVGGGSSISFPTGKSNIVYTSGTSIYELTNTNYLLATNNLSELTNAATARTNLGLGTAATLNVGTSANQIVQLDGAAKLPAVDGSQLTNLPGVSSFSNITITGGTITGITDLAIADGGTGASTAANARTNLGLGTMATQNSNNVSITGGTITGVTGFPSVTNSASGKVVIGAITIQWGSNNSSGAISFGTAFSSTPYSITATPRGSTTTDASHSWDIHSVSDSGFQIRSEVAGGSADNATYNWIAIGPT